MKTYRSTLRTMKLVILVCQLVLILRTGAQIPDGCTDTGPNRSPQDEDIMVTCGTKYMDLSIYICPMYQALYNESMMVLNNQPNNPECYGTADWNVSPPVLKFRLPINESALTVCGNKLKTITDVGSGPFADYSQVQHINISGSVTSIDPTAGTITYRRLILYKFSCQYPMQYLVNNTQVGVSGVSIAIKDINGTFRTTLGMKLYESEQYESELVIPPQGLNLKTKIYVLVKATNLTDRFNLLLDRCWATTSPDPEHLEFYELFVGCTRDAQTKVNLNGKKQWAEFSFEAFRFVIHKNMTVSTFYLHCAVRLCEPSKCIALLPDCTNPAKRRKREAEGVSPNATITSPLISVGAQIAEEAQTYSASLDASSQSNYSSPVVAIIVCLALIAIFIAGMTVYLGLYIRRRKPLLS